MRAVSMGDGGNFNNPFDQGQRQPEELRQPPANGAANGIAGSNHTGNIDHGNSGLRYFLAFLYEEKKILYSLEYRYKTIPS